MGSYITIADAREDIMDRSADDHLVLIDLAFQDEDYEYAMKACARKFNSIKPFSATVSYDTLPQSSDVFMTGVAWALYRRWHRNVSINDFDYSAAGVSATVQGSLLKNLKELRDKNEADFVNGATDLKVHMNLNAAYGGIG